MKIRTVNIANRSFSAFSLAELSFIIMIISFLLVVMFSGVQLLNQSKVKFFINDLTSYLAAVRNFENSYDALPGDFSEAESFFTNANNLNNGNGDGEVDWSSEVYDANLHLAKAEMIDGQQFTGDSNKYISLLKNIDGLGKILINTALDSDYFFLKKNVMQFGGGSEADEAILLPEDAYEIDKKLDDGLPKKGKITFKDTNKNLDIKCTNSTDEYFFDSTELGCNIIYVLN